MFFFPIASPLCVLLLLYVMCLMYSTERGKHHIIYHSALKLKKIVQITHVRISASTFISKDKINFKQREACYFAAPRPTVGPLAKISKNIDFGAYTKRQSRLLKLRFFRILEHCTLRNLFFLFSKKTRAKIFKTAFFS